MKIKALFLSVVVTALLGLMPAYTSGQIRPVVVSRAQMQTLLTRIENRTDRFRDEAIRSMNNTRVDNTRAENNIANYIRDFEDATDALRNGFNARRDVDNEVREVLNRGRVIDGVMARLALSAAAETQWRNLRADLNSLASLYRISWNWNGPIGGLPPMGGWTPPYTVTDPQLRNLLSRIETRTDTFKQTVDRALDRTRLNNTNREDDVMAFITEFENATDRLRQRFDSRQTIDEDANEVLLRAAYVNRFMARNRLTMPAQNQWRNIRNDLNTLARYYQVSWNWNQQLPPWSPGGFPSDNFPGSFDASLTGTYRLNRSASDNVINVVDRSLGSVTAAQRERLRRNLERRLGSPEMIAIEKNGRQVILASSLAPQVTLTADNIGRSETNNRGRTITTTVSSNNNDLTISYVGDRANDFYLTFEPSGNQLYVTRRIYLENRNEQVTVRSVYDKIDNVARWSSVNTGTGTGTVWNGNTGSFYVPNGTRMTAILRNLVDARVSQPGDRFTMEVTGPAQYRGAIIEGRVAQADTSGRVTGRAQLSLEFDTIQVGGNTYRFAGLIDSVRTPDGDNVSVSNEGTVRDRNQTTQTITRAGIGAALGALIGAIAGGGEGAAVGAAIGAGAGAGTVFIQGRDNIQLEQGTVFNITASAPNNVAFTR